MALTFFWRCEGATLDGTHDYSAGDAVASLSGATISSSFARAGSNSLYINDLAHRAIFDDADDIIDVTEGSAAFSFYRDTGGTLDGELLNLVDFDTTSNHIVVQENAGQLDLGIRNGGTESFASTTGLSLADGNWYGVVIRWHQSNLDIRIEVYDANGALLDSGENLSVTSGDWPSNTDVDSLIIGDSGAGFPGGIYIDNVMVSDTYTDRLEKLLHLSSYADVNLLAEDLTFFWRCEGTTLDATDDYSIGDTTATLSGPAALNSDNVRVGTNSLDSVSDVGYATFALASNIIDTSEGSFGAWFYIEQNWAGVSLFRAYDASSGNDQIAIMVTGTTGSGNARLRIGTSGFGEQDIETTGAALAEDNWYFVVARWDLAATTGRIEVYDTSLTIITSAQNTSVSTTFFPVTADLDTFDILAIGGGNLWAQADNIFVSDSYSAALEDWAEITTYQDYGVAAGGPVITDVNTTETWTDGDTGLVITGTGFV